MRPRVGTGGYPHASLDSVRAVQLIPSSISAPDEALLLEQLEASSAATTGRARPWRLLVFGCVVLGVVSLLLPSVPTYDPWAWLLWGREVLHGHLVTTTGPSGKPLPVMFTTPFAVLGDTTAPLAWLVVARAGGILAVAMAYRLASRLAGRPAGVIAAVALVLCHEFIFNFFRGNSE